VYYGNNLFLFIVDQDFANNTYSSLQFSKISPNILREGQVDPVTTLQIFGTGISVQEFEAKLECHFEVGSVYKEIISATIISEHSIE
jgi:hypothetical protein